MHSQCILLTTSQCHLCTDAKNLLKNMNVEYTVKDIDDDEMLLLEYRLLVPVLLYRDNELKWPFNSLDVMNFIEKIE